MNLQLQAPRAADDLDEVIVAYLKLVESGDRPDRDEWLRRHPQHAEDLGEFFRDQDNLQEWVGPLATVHYPNGDTAPAFGGDASSAPAGRSVGDYDLLEEIGRGGMGIVYRAHQKSLSRVVAVKMMQPGRMAESADRQRFRGEAEAAARLDHPGIVPIYEVGEVSGRPFFSMKFLAGGSLEHRLGEYGVEPHRAAGLLAAVARAVHHAHQSGLLHRDLKPANILLDEKGRPLVADFGLAKWIDGPGGPSHSGFIVGTPAYMAPEQASRAGGNTLSDVYSLGGILYALLTGRPPFQGDSPLDTLVQVKTRMPAPPRQLNPAVARDLEIICLKCLEKEPARRYESAQALAEDLDRWRTGHPIQARPAGRLERTIRWCRRNPLLASVLGGAAIGAVALAITTGQLWRETTRTEQALDQAKQEREEADAQRRRAEQNFRRSIQGVTRMVLAAFGPPRPTDPQVIQKVHSLCDEALRFYQEFAPDRGTSPEIHMELGIAHTHVGILYGIIGAQDQAVATLKRAIALFDALVADFPDNPDYRIESGMRIVLADILAQAGRKTDATEYYRQGELVYREAAERFPENARAQDCYAWFLATCKDPAFRNPTRAAAVAEKAVALRPESASMWNTLAVAHYRAANWDMTRTAALRAEKLQPESVAGNLSLLAMIHWQLSKEDEARRWLERAVKWRERHPELDDQFEIEAAQLLNPKR